MSTFSSLGQIDKHENYKTYFSIHWKIGYDVSYRGDYECLTV